MIDLSLTKKLLAKSSMEKVMAQDGRTVEHYHAENGRFSDNGFIDAVNGKDQKITFCGVGAHHQIGIIENKIKSSQQEDALSCFMADECGPCCENFIFIFYDYVLVVRAYATECDLLIFPINSVDKNIVRKPSVVGVVVL